MGGKVLIPTEKPSATSSRRAWRPTCSASDAHRRAHRCQGAKLLTSDIDPRDQPFLTGERTAEGFFRSGRPRCGHRARPRLRPVRRPALVRNLRAQSRRGARFADAIHAKYPGKLLAYNCSPSFNWKNNSTTTIATFPQQLAAMGYKFQFITLAGFHALNHSMFELARDFKDRGMSAYAEFQQRVRERAARLHGHAPPAEVGTGYFDDIAQVVSEGKSSTTALHGSTEAEQFHPAGVH